MQTRRFILVVAAVLALLYALFWHWQTPGESGRLTRAEIDDFLAVMEADFPLPEEEKPSFLARMRAWGEADDGKPVYMLNIMRYHDEIVAVPGVDGIAGTPHESNQYYEDQVLPLIFKLGAYPLIGADVVGISEDGSQHSNIAGFGPELDDWGRVIVVRYPNRRAYFRLFSDPAYASIVPYKLAALEVGLAPIAPEVVIPELRLTLAGVLLMLFLGVGWWRAARDCRSQAVPLGQLH